MLRKLPVAVDLLAIAGAAPADVLVDIVKQPYSGSRNVDELSLNPDYFHAAGLERLVRDWGGELVRPVQDIRLTPAQDRQRQTSERFHAEDGRVNGDGEAVLAGELRAKLARFVLDEQARVRANYQLY